MKQYEVSKILEMVINLVNENPRVQKMQLVNAIRNENYFENSFELCSQFIEWLKIKKYLKVHHVFYGYLRITEKSEAWISEKSEIWVSEKSLKNIKENYQLLMGLKLVRKIISEEKQIDLFKVCPNYMLEKLARFQPNDLDELFKISGFKEWKGDTQWHKYLEVIQDWKQKQLENYPMSA